MSALGIRYTLLSMLPALILLLIVLAIVGAGISFIRRARHGRPIDDHPICRRCGFDLIGLPQDVHRCSECGRDLREPRAIIQGRRVRQPGLMVLGALLVIVPLASLGELAYLSVQQS